MADIFGSDDEDQEVPKPSNNTSSSNKSKLPIYSSDEDDTPAASANNNKPNLLALMSDDDDSGNEQPAAAPAADKKQQITAMFGEDLSEDEAVADNKSDAADSDDSSVQKKKKTKSLGKSNQRKASKPAVAAKNAMDSDDDVFKSDDEENNDKDTKGEEKKGEGELDKMLGTDPAKDDGLTVKTVEMELGTRHGVAAGAKKLFVKMPNFLRCQPQSFVRGEYKGSEEKTTFEGATAVIRCMQKGDQLLSNARIIKWDDGTQQLVIANEVYNMRFNPVDNCYIYEVQKSREKGGDQNGETVLECNGVIEDRVNIIPISLKSATHAIMTHDLLKNSVNKKSTAIVVQHLDEMANPEKVMRELAKQEEEDIRKQMRAMQKNRAQQQPSYTQVQPRGRGVLARPGLDAEYMEEDDEDEGDDNDSFIDNNKYSDNEDDLDANSGSEGSQEPDEKKAKKRAADSTEKTAEKSKDEADESTNVEDEEDGNYAPQMKKRQKTTMFDDDSE